MRLIFKYPLRLERWRKGLDGDASSLLETGNGRAVSGTALIRDRPQIELYRSDDHLFFVLRQRPNHHVPSSHFVSVLVIVAQSLATNLFDNAEDTVVSLKNAVR